MTTELVINGSPTERTLSVNNSDQSLSLDEGTYYRSRVFTATCGVNALVSSAQPLLALLSRLQQSIAPPDIDQLANNVLHELKTFESRCLQFRFEHESILLGRYLVCVAIEDCIDALPWSQQWQERDPLAPYFPSDHDSEHLLILLDRISEQPEKYIDVVELAYLCLSLGSPSRVWDTAKGKVPLITVLDQLYQRIRQYRGETPSQLNPSPLPEAPPNDSEPLIPVKWTMLTVVLLLATFYAIFSYMITINSDLLPFINHHQSVMTQGDRYENL